MSDGRDPDVPSAADVGLNGVHSVIRRSISDPPSSNYFPSLVNLADPWIINPLITHLVTPLCLRVIFFFLFQAGCQTSNISSEGLTVSPGKSAWNRTYLKISTKPPAAVWFVIWSRCLPLYRHSKATFHIRRRQFGSSSQIQHQLPYNRTSVSSVHIRGAKQNGMRGKQSSPLVECLY